MSLSERALAALDIAFDEQIKARFGWLIGQEAGDGGGKKGDLESFRAGVTEVKNAYGDARAILQKVFA